MQGVPRVPGWELIGDRESVDIQDSGAQYVQGRWYCPVRGEFSLQRVVGEWLDALERLWSRVSREVGGIRCGIGTNEAEHVEEVLRAWGRMDHTGHTVLDQ